MTDELRDIPGYPGYAVTLDGRVWSKPRKDSRGCKQGGFWMKSGIRPDGHLDVHLRVAGRYRIRKVHRLVLEAFVGPCPAGMECRHLNGNPSDNRVENLAWGTRSENCQDAIRQGTSYCVTQPKGGDKPNSKLHEDDVRIIFHAYHDGYYSQREIAEAFGICVSTVLAIAKKRKWSHLWD